MKINDNKFGYKIVLRKNKRRKFPFFRIVVLTKANKYRFFLGSVDLVSNKRTSIIYINKLMLYYWLYKGAKCSHSIYKILNLLLLEQK